MDSLPFIFISGQDVQRLLDRKQLLVALEMAFGHFSQGPAGGVVQPVRVMVPIADHKGFLLSMPGYSSQGQALATKLVTLYPGNAEKGIPTHNGYICLFDSSTGVLIALVDAKSVTAIRTATASAVATKHLANPQSKILALLGAGVQAESHYEALRLLFDFDEVRVWSQDGAEKLAGKIRGGRACSSAQEAVRGADIICTVTLATTPVLHKEWVKPGAHINGLSYGIIIRDSDPFGQIIRAVGAPRPDWQEIDPELMRSAVVYADTKDACYKESGDIIISKVQIFAEIGEVINKTKPARWRETTLFKSVGMALEDVVSAKMVFEKFQRNKSKL